jgi:hypothetical protein
LACRAAVQRRSPGTGQRAVERSRLRRWRWHRRRWLDGGRVDRAGRASASTTSATTAASTTSGPLPRSTRHRVAACSRKDADPQEQLSPRQGAPRSLEASAARARRRPEPESRRAQAPRLPGQPAGRPPLTARNTGARFPGTPLKPPRTARELPLSDHPPVRSAAGPSGTAARCHGGKANRSSNSSV